MAATLPPAHTQPFETEKSYDQNHPLAGVPGYSIERVAAPENCGGFAIVIKGPKKKPTKELATFLDVMRDEPPPMDLSNFEANLKKRMEWSNAHNKRVEGFVAEIMADLKSADDRVKQAAAARLIQLQLHEAAKAMYARTSKGSTPESRQVFCDGMARQAKPFLDQAHIEIGACIDLFKNATRGWWNDVCR